MDRLKAQVLPSKKRRKSNKPKLSVIVAYAGVFIVLISLIAFGYQPPKPSNTLSNASVEPSPVAKSLTPTPEVVKASVDELVATKIAVNIAEQTDMMVAPIISGYESDLVVKKNLDQTSTTAIVKSDVAQIDDTDQTITTYVFKEGDSLAAIAAKFKISVQTLKWANSLTTDSVAVGKELTIPPTDGVVYTVKAGDTVDSVAKTYKASVDRIVSLNNLELSGLVPGAKITIPGGDLPENQRPGYVAPRPQIQEYFNRGVMDMSGFAIIGRGFAPGTDLGGYAPGNCTAYAYVRRAQMGNPIGRMWGNGADWLRSARNAGVSTGLTPRPGAIAYWGAYQGGSGWAGHVGIVEYVNGDRVTISEMNYGWNYNVISQRTINANSVTAYIY